MKRKTKKSPQFPIVNYLLIIALLCCLTNAALGYFVPFYSIKAMLMNFCIIAVVIALLHIVRQLRLALPYRIAVYGVYTLLGLSQGALSVFVARQPGNDSTYLLIFSFVLEILLLFLSDTLPRKR